MFWKIGRKPNSDKIQRLLVKLTLIHSLSLFLFILFVTLVIYFGFKYNLEQEDDNFLVQKYESVVHTLDLYSPSDAEFKQQVGFSGKDSKSFFYVRIQDANHQTLFSSLPEFEKDFLSSSIMKLWVKEGAYEMIKAATKNEREFRAIRSTSPTSGDGAYFVEVWMDRTSDDSLLKGYGRLMLLALLVSLILSPTIGYTLAKNALRPIQNNMKKLVQFSDDLAHELRTPLSNLQGEIEISLSRDREPLEYINTMSSSLEEIDRLKKIIDGLLFLARVEQEQFKMSQNIISVREELKGVVEFYEAAADEQGLKLGFIDAADDFEITANKALFQQAIGNLVANAIKYTPAGGRIQVSYKKEGLHCKIIVTDKGAGIASEHIPFIFDRFYRVDSARSREAGGLGLGLAITKSIAEVHGGQIIVHSSLGKGSTFIISFRSEISKSSS